MKQDLSGMTPPRTKSGEAKASRQRALDNDNIELQSTLCCEQRMCQMSNYSCRNVCKNNLNNLNIRAKTDELT